jgi:ABC-type transport system involved in cytochrome c biogenesis permease subunit
MPEAALILAVLLMAAATVVAWRSPEKGVRLLVGLLSLATLSAGWVIAERWLRTGYGPFLTLYEVLLSNVFSLGLILALTCVLKPGAVRSLPLALPVVLVLGLWALESPKEPAQLPATFDSPWLWLHVGTGKVFLGMLLVAVGLAVSDLIRRGDADGRTDDLVWRFASIAFVFDSAMLITGALWANHAWGRYWNWDPVETWALLTWLTLGLCLHARVTWRLPLSAGRLMLVGVFVLAFLTLFGMPFLSLGPHKGVL